MHTASQLITGNTAADDASSPSGAGQAFVSQIYAPRHPLLAWLSIMVTSVAWLIWYSDTQRESDPIGLWTALKAMGGMLIIMLGLVCAWIFVDGKLDPRTKTSNCFVGEVKLRMDRDGVHVEGFRTIVWSDLVSYERFPHADNFFLLHTAHGYSLQVSGDRDVFEPVITHYFSPGSTAAGADCPQAMRDGQCASSPEPSTEAHCVQNKLGL